MLMKLLKHEFQATGRYMWIVYAAIALISVGGFLGTRFLGGNLDAMEERPALGIVLVLIIAVWFLALLAVVIVTLVMNVYRFYKNFLSDEGYLMFTLPVSRRQLVLSKLMVAMVWTMISSLIIMGGFGLLIWNLVGGMVEVEIETMFSSYFYTVGVNIPLLAVELLLVALAGTASQILEIYAVMSVGYGFAKNKALYSVLLYFLVQAGMQILGGVGSIIMLLLETADFPLVAFYENMSVMAQVSLTMGGTLVLSLVLSGIFYFVTIRSLKKRLNLP